MKRFTSIICKVIFVPKTFELLPFKTWSDCLWKTAVFVVFLQMRLKENYAKYFCPFQKHFYNKYHICPG